jgi:hypothetical protein
MQYSADRYKPNVGRMMNEWWTPINGVNEHGFELFEKENRWRVYNHFIDDWVLEIEKGSLKLNN